MLKVSVSGNPLIDKFLKPDGIQKFTAYRDFKAAVHHYQRQHHVSGVVWRQLIIKERTLHYPVVHEQLAALPDDLKVLKTAKDSILNFWHTVTEDMDLYLSVNSGKEYRQITAQDVSVILYQTEWVNLSRHGNSNFLEIILQLGWGKPEEASYKRGWPASGSENIHAVNPGERPIC